ncbi:ketopantoate reductase family protein [Aureivirga sp. CE67]|uniref:ketopantoate reductase family protein n=1 Tax=Aureivirga sp. CE67 TaxID=1788983 RepID=UPI0018CA2CB9|nr:ketopantoate reductase family protein [Aureivirga sp. CE67]
MKVVIIGAGAIGGYFGAMLAKDGNDVTFVARGNHLRAMQTNGLEVKSTLGNFKLNEVTATDDIYSIEKPDLIIHTTKTWQVKDTLPAIAAIMKDDTVVVPLQNGISIAEEMQSRIPKKNIIQGSCKILSKIEEPGVINHFGDKPMITIGEYNQEFTPRLKHIENVLTSARIPTLMTDDIEKKLWEKFVLICTGGLISISDTSFGRVREVPETRALLRDSLVEICEVSQKVNGKLDVAFADKIMETIDNFPYEGATSTCRDLWNGKHSEIDYLNGMVVKLGKEHNVPTPVNDIIYYVNLPREFKARGMK